MLPKTPGAVGCRHCQRLGATSVCPSCGRPVCAACHVDLTSCPDPSPRLLKLGMGARLREVDASGRFGLVTTWRMARRIVNLGGGQRHRVPIISGTGAEILSARADDVLPWPCPLPTGGLVASVNLTGFEGIYIWRDAPSAEHRSVRPLVISLDEWAVVPKRLCLSEDSEFAAVARDDEQVDVIDIVDGRHLRRLCEPGHVVHAIALSHAADLVALGAYGQVTLFRLSDGDRLGALPVSDGNLRWIGISRAVIATITEHGVLEARRIVRRGKPAGWPPLRCPPALGRAVKTPYEASISADGRLLALRGRRKLVQVLDLQTGGLRELTAHTDRVNLVRFVRDGRALVTADYDNRVVTWPRLGNALVHEIPSRPRRPPTLRDAAALKAADRDAERDRDVATPEAET